jgi:hypothetical protein
MPLVRAAPSGRVATRRARYGLVVRLADASTSPLYERVVFVLAPPLSGAESVVRLLATAPGVVAGPGPSRLFETAVPQLIGNYELGEGFGLAALVDEGEFVTAVRRLTDSILGGAANGSTLVEYTPRHAEHAGFLTAVYPDARLLQVVRDPRSVAAAAGLRKALPAARTWAAAHRSVLGAFGSGSLTTVRVESLRGPDEVTALLHALDLEPGPQTAAAADDLVRSTAAGSLPPPLGRAVDVFAGDLLELFGYGRGRRR